MVKLFSLNDYSVMQIQCLLSRLVKSYTLTRNINPFSTTYWVLFMGTSLGTSFFTMVFQTENIEQYSEGSEHTILVLDDIMLKICKSEDCVDLVTVTSHHRCITTIFLSQNLYPPGKYSRTISLDCSNNVLFKIFVTQDK